MLWRADRRWAAEQYASIPTALDLIAGITTLKFVEG